MHEKPEPGADGADMLRRRVLQALALGAAGVAAGPALLTEPAVAATRDTTTSPQDLRFTITERLRPVEPLSSFHTLDESFATPLRGYETLPVSGFAAPALADSGQHRLIASGAQPFGTLWRSSAGQLAPYATVVVGVAESSGDIQVGAGLARDAGNTITGWWDLATGMVTLEVSVNGTTTVLQANSARVIGNTSHWDTAPLCAPGHTLGQSFVTTDAFASVGALLPTYGDATSQCTLTLRKSGPGGEIIASRRLALSIDNQWWDLTLDSAAPAGSYYIEQSDGSGHAAWWSSSTNVVDDGTAYADGAAVTGDRAYRVALVSPPALPARFAVSVCGDQAAAFGATRSDGWQELAVARVADHVDLRDPALLPYYRDTFGVRGQSGSATIMAVNGGYFGAVGIRDLAAITTSDGAPVIKSGWVYLTATNAGLRSAPSAHQGVWRLNLSDYTKFEEVGKLFYRRDGLIVGDSAGKIVVTGPRDLVILASTWGTVDKNLPVNVALASTPAGTGYEGVHVLTESRVLLGNTYDPFIVFTGGHWYMAVAGLMIWQFGPGLSNPVLIGHDDAGFYEGPRITRIGGTYYAIWGGLRDFRIYDLQMNFVGFLNAQHPQAPDYPFVNPPHPQIVPVCNGDTTRFVLVTFSGATGPFGEVGQLVVEDDQLRVRGCEF